MRTLNNTHHPVMHGDNKTDGGPELIPHMFVHNSKMAAFGTMLLAASSSIASSSLDGPTDRQKAHEW